MRRQKQGQFATFAMLIPMFAVPVMAVFGIPQFAPVVASPADEQHPDWLSDDGFHRVGQADAYSPRSLTSVSSDPDQLDLFQPWDPEASSDRDPALPSSNWTDPLQLASAPGQDRRTVSPAGGSPTAAVSTLTNARAGNRQPDSRSREHLPESAGSVRPPVAPTVAGQSVAQQPVPERSVAGRSASHSSEYGRSRTALHPKHSTWRRAVNRLNQLGIRTYRLSPSETDGRYYFMCLVTSADDPRISRRFEAEAREPLDAVDYVLAQVEEWNQVR